MNPGFVVRFRPVGPWRIGPGSGARNQVDCILHSDSLFSAVTQAMARLGRLEEWLAATVENPQGPVARFGSLFPCLEEVQFVVPPRTLWPPPLSPKVRWRDARFVPLSVVTALITEQPLDDNAWHLDGASECLLPKEGPFHSGPFRPASRRSAAVDRLRMDTVEVHSAACLEYAEGGGLWAVVSLADEAANATWSGPIRAALRLLADTGLGGERSLGWGRSGEPEFIEGSLPAMILPSVGQAQPSEEPPLPETAYWLLSMFSPAPDEAVDWQRGSYSLVSRAGRVESPVRSGEPKKLVRMVEEGSVLVAGRPLKGAAPNVAPDGFPHPVFRYGFPVAIPVPLRGGQGLPAWEAVRA